MDLTNIQGLSQQEAATRLKAEGFNELPSPERRTPWKIILSVITEPMFALLILAGVVYLILGDIQESLVLVAFVMLSVVITVVQEVRSEHVLESLRDMTSPRALVMRDGQPVRIAGRDVVRGDVIIVKEGDRVSADALIFSGDDIQIDESMLTGESAPVRKKPTQETAEVMPPPGGEDSPGIYAGTLIVRGTGRAVVLATGLRSQIGKIGQSLVSIETQQPRLRAQTRKIVLAFAAFALLASAGVVVISGLMHGNWLKALLNGIALGMALLPEEFPLVLAVFMVMGAWRISKARVLTRRAAAIETLGSATVLCTDKTGTLTQNKMSITQIKSGEISWQTGSEMPPTLSGIIHTGAMASLKDAFDPMDMAFFDLEDKSVATETPVHHYSLNHNLLVMANVYNKDGRYFIAAKGAPEAIAKICKLDAPQLEKMQATINDMAEQGIRVLGVAKASADIGSLPETPEGFQFEFIGLVGFTDPLRPTVPAAVKEAQGAGIRIIMITGDYPKTAQTIAGQAGIISGTVITGEELQKMTDEDLKSAVKEVSVFARIMPDQKLRIVNALKANGEVVAMTGDGVNDAPSLKAAHIGIAMGGRGTDVAREASSIVLLDDDFSSLVTTIRLGRRIYDNLKKAFLYIIAVHVPVAGLAMLPVFLDKPLIMTPLLIAFMEMIIDPTCSIVLEAEEGEKNIMKIPPRDPKTSIISARILGFGFIQGTLALIMAGGLWFYATARALPENEIRSLVFATLTMINLALILANRSFSPSLLSAFRRPNPFLWKGLFSVAAIFSVAMFWPPAQKLFHFGPLHLHDILIALVSGLALLVTLEGIKTLRKKRLEP